MGLFLVQIHNYRTVRRENIWRCGIHKLAEHWPGPAWVLCNKNGCFVVKVILKILQKESA